MTIRKIKVTKPIVDMNGDEMTRLIWELIKNKLILPYIDFGVNNQNLLEYDLGLLHRNATDDQVTIDAANAVKQHGVGIKCATITPDEKRMKEFADMKTPLKMMWKSPNGTIRNALDGVVFREPIVIGFIPLVVPNWTSSFIIARHGYGDQYKAAEMRIDMPGTVKMVFTPTDGGEEKTINVHKFSNPGVAMAMHNTDESIYAFARNSFRMAVEKKWNLYFSTKNTILKIYDGRFKDIFEEVYKNEYATTFTDLGITYQHRLIDDMVAYAMRMPGNFVWALKNYDGDVQSDSVAQGFGSLGLMTSILTSVDGSISVSEAAHGTVTGHYIRYKEMIAKGEDPWNFISTNPVASIFAWTGGFKKRAELDNNTALQLFAETLEATVIETIENGCYTRDIAKLVEKNPRPPRDTWATTMAFLNKIDTCLQKKLQPEHVEA